MSDEAVEQTTDTEPVIAEPAAEQVVIHNSDNMDHAPDEQSDPYDFDMKNEDGSINWKSAARKWERVAKVNGVDVDEVRKRPATTQPAQPVEPAQATETAEPAAETEQETAKADPLVIENLVLRAAPKLGADADDLLDSRSLMADLEALDSTADDYADQVQAAIKAAVDARPSLAGKPARAGKSGNPVGGGPTSVELDPKKLATPNTNGPKVRLY